MRSPSPSSEELPGGGGSSDGVQSGVMPLETSSSRSGSGGGAAANGVERPRTTRDGRVPDLDFF